MVERENTQHEELIEDLTVSESRAGEVTAGSGFSRIHVHDITVTKDLD